MKKVNKRIPKFKLFLIIILICTMVLSIGYAASNLISLEITGFLTSKIPEGIYISSVVKVDSSDASDTINKYSDTIINSSIFLSNTALDSYVEYEITISNNDTIDYSFNGFTYEDSFYIDQNNNFNSEIVYDVINDNEDKIIRQHETYVVHLRFHYKEGLSEITQSTLNSVLKINTDSSRLKLGPNILASAPVIANTYIETNGAEIPYNNWSSTDFVDISDYDRLIIKNANKYCAFYDENKNFIQNISKPSSVLSNAVIGDTTVAFAFITLPSNAKYLRVSAASNSLSSITAQPVNNGFDNTFTVDVKALDITLQDKLYGVDNIVLNTYVTASGIETKYNGWSSTHYVDVSDYEKVVITKYSPNQYGGMYDENKKFIKNFNSTSVSEIIVNGVTYYQYTVPSNIKYIRLSRDTKDMQQMEIYSFELVNATTENLVISSDLIAQNIVPNTYIDTNGAEIAYTGWSSTDFVDIQNSKYLLQKGSLSNYSAIYDCDKKYISSVLPKSKDIKIIDANINGKILDISNLPNACYIRLSDNTSNMSGVRIYKINDDFNGHLVFTIK